MSTTDWLAFATRFELKGVKIEKRSTKPGVDSWAILLDGEVLNKDGTWEYEPSPSNRDDDFIARTRFTRDEAFARVERLELEL